MPLIVLTGYPCSGLTYRARQLVSQLEATQTELFNSGALPPTKPRYKVHVVPTHDPSHPRTVYDHARTEKESRGVAYARAKRALNKDSFVILDGMNYIKGYRYQLWCEAKALGTTCCVVRLPPRPPPSQATSNNPSTRSTLAPRSTNASQTTRPDCAVKTTQTTLKTSHHPEASTAPTLSSLTNTLSTTTLSSTPSVTTTAAPRGGTLGRPKIKPHQATALPAQTDSTALYSMEKRTSAIVTSIRNYTSSNPSAEAALALAQSQNPNTRAPGISIPVPEASTPVYIPAHVATSGTTDELAGAGGILALPRLQRLRRQWIALNRAYVQGAHASSKGGLTAEQVPDAFVRFLNAEFGGESE
ncbi:chromatin associated protein KTI12 [Aspergillus sclerotioniger CBS 115572]|uniref:Chromatin associated protein KTI12 n=1 Tax=Aspergillus sclerotioniger CBS 115572 TaxID=1450535 RepID=A0A317WJL9_9EURO|nr:chromatin associated protein KTI12 [Aspergillus sclerotioniger CBS 115572]PWY86519.1 chromatin associated protein KTI12 [Aspergillus sclerotioniger CBS 115572]